MTPWRAKFRKLDSKPREILAHLRCFTRASFWATFRANMSLSKASPTLPEVYDEAGNTPSWVPVLGVGLFMLFALFFGARYLAHKDLPPSAAPEASDTGSAPAQPSSAQTAPSS